MKKLSKNLWIAALAVILCISLLFTVSFSVKAESTDGYQYLLTFSDNFDGKLADGWRAVKGGSSYTYQNGDKTVIGWNFKGETTVNYKKEGATDFGKFIYGTADMTDYVFEVKMRADVTETVGEYLTKNSANLGAGLTVNTHIPFFVTEISPDSNTHTFKGRSVCVSNYAIGFYEYGETSGWATGATSRINTKLGDDFDWRNWHTIRVKANAEKCELYLDDVLMVSAANSAFTRATATAGYCGFAGICSAKYVPLSFDDFNVWQKNPSYDENAKTEVSVNNINMNDFTDKSKIFSFSGNVGQALVKNSENKIIYNYDATGTWYGTDVRLLKDYSFDDFETTIAFDIDNQKKAKGITSDDVVTSNNNTDVRVGDTGFIFRGNADNGKASGYILNYLAEWSRSNAKRNFVVLTISHIQDNVRKTAVANNFITIGTISGTTSCVVDLKVEGDTATVTAYKTLADKEAGTVALTKTVTLSAATTKTYDEGNVGFWVNTGNSTLKFVYEAQMLSFKGKTLVSGVELQPAEEASGNRYIDIVSDAEKGEVKIDGAIASAKNTVSAGSDVTLTVTAKEGFVIDNVKLNGMNLGPKTSLKISHVTKDQNVEVTYSDNKNVDVYILAGQSNAAGFTPIASLFKPYTYGGEMNADKVNEYMNGYKDVLYYGVAQSNSPETAGVTWSVVSSGKGANAYRIGPELGFAEAMSAYYGGSNGKAALIKYAVGSTGFTNANGTVTGTYGNWMSPSLREEKVGQGVTLIEKAGLMYDNLIKTFEMGLSDLIAQGYNPVIKGALWLQGCQDACVEADAPQYGNYISLLIKDLRQNVGEILTENNIEQDVSEMPFVICKIGEDLQGAEYEDIVRKQMQMTAASVVNVRIVETTGFILPDENDNNDRWHFAGKDIIEIGKRFASVVNQMNGKTEEVKFTVTFDTDGGSSVESQSVLQYMSAVKPEEDPTKEGFVFSHWAAEGSTEEFDFAATAIQSDITLKAIFVTPCKVTIGECEHGSVSVSKTNAMSGSEIVVTATPDIGYKLKAILVDGEEIEGDTFIITGDVVVSAIFVEDENYVAITVGDCEHGSISVDKDNEYIGNTVNVIVTPDKGYKLKAIYVNGEKIEGTYFTVAAASVVTAEFEADENYVAITVGNCEHGSVTVDNDHQYINMTVTVTATPEKGYKLKAIYVNGVEIEGNTFIVTGETVVTAEFVKDETNAGGCGSNVNVLGATVAVMAMLASALFIVKKKLTD